MLANNYSIAMKEHFATELDSLHAAMQEFSAHHPEQAEALNLQSTASNDPHIDRLLEGVAFLTASLKSKIDDELPEVCENLLLSTWSNMVRPFPSTTIMEFTPRLGQLHKSHLLQASSKITSNNQHSSQQCTFSTSRDLTINPLQINEIKLVENRLLTIDIQAAPNVNLNSLDLKQMPFYISAEHGTAVQLFHLLTADVVTVEVLLTKQQQTIYLDGRNSITPTISLTKNSTEHPQNYFLFRNSLLFISILGLEEIAWPEQCQQFKLIIGLRNSLANAPPINRETLRLHCVPALNLYQKSSEPITITHRKHEYKITPDSDIEKQEIIYSVDDINTNSDYLLTKQDNSYYITLNNNFDITHKVLSAKLTVCNGYLPHQTLTANAITTPTSDIPYYISCSNLTPPTPMHIPPKTDRYPWQLISMMRLSLHSLTEINNLHEQLELFNWQNSNEDTQHISAISNIITTTKNVIHHGCMHQTVITQLTINEECYRSLEDIYLFGLMLHRLFVAHVNINYLLTTKIVCTPSNRELLWQEQPGVNLPL